jgi:putative methanogenesis marker protein 3
MLDVGGHRLKVILDGVASDIEPGITVEALAKRLGVSLVPGCTLALKRAVPPEKLETNLYRVSTTKGSMVVRLECEKVAAGWRKAYGRFKGSGVRWVTRDAAVFGPIVTDFEPSKGNVELRQYEIALSLSGYDNEATHLVFSKKLHSSAYAPPKGCGAVGRVVYGRHLVDLLRMGDIIEGIEPVVEVKEGMGAVQKVDANQELKEPGEVFTRINIELDGASPDSGEVVYKAMADGAFNVARKTSRYVACDDLSLVMLKAEKVQRRNRGSITVRNSGSRVGSVYIYLREAALTPSHNMAGRVGRGLELASILDEGERVAVDVLPRRLDLLGGTLAEAEKVLATRFLKMTRLGDSSDRALVVDQDPPTTLEAYAAKGVTCTGVDPSRVLKVRLFQDRAPVTSKYFRRVTGVEMRRVGKLEVFFTTPKNDIVLFKGDEVLSKVLLPENTPTSKVSAKLIGVTNTIKRFAGMVGVRFAESEEFGPTAEKFDGTNIVGEVVGNLDAIKGLKAKDVVYLMEENS